MTPTWLWRWNRQSVPKRRNIKFRRRGITQTKIHNIQNKAKVWNQECFGSLNHHQAKYKTQYWYSQRVHIHWLYRYCVLYLVWWWLSEPKHVAVIFNFNSDYQYMLCYWLNKLLHIIRVGCETWSRTLSEERRLRVLKNRVPRRKFEPKRDDVTEEWRRVHNEELNDLYCSLNINPFR